MKTRIAVLRTAVGVAAMMLAMTAGAATVPPGPPEDLLPGWQDQAQVWLGWTFDGLESSLTDDPRNRYIGDDPPAWDLVQSQNGDGSGGVVTSQQPSYWWWLHLPNVNQDNPYKRIWMSFVYSADQAVPEGAIEITASPQEGQELLSWVSEGTPDDVWQTTVEYRLWPNPYWEEIWFPVEDPDTVPQLHEAYIMTECVPEPATMTVLGIGLAGFAVRRFRQRFQG